MKNKKITFYSLVFCMQFFFLIGDVKADNPSLYYQNGYDPALNGTEGYTAPAPATNGCATGEYKGKDGKCYSNENLGVTATGDSNPTCDPDPSCWFWNCCSSGSSSSTSTTSGGGDSSSNLIMCANGICRDGNGNPIVNSTTSGAASSTYRPGPKCGTDGKFTDIGGVCFPNNTGLSNAPVYVILSNIFSWLMGLFTTLAILAFVFSGTQYFLSTADEDMAKAAKKNATNAVIGIIVGLSGFVIIRAIAAALQGQSYFF